MYSNVAIHLFLPVGAIGGASNSIREAIGTARPLVPPLGALQGQWIAAVVCVIHLSMFLCELYLTMRQLSKLTSVISVWRSVQQIGVEKCRSNYLAWVWAGAITSDCIDRFSSLADIKSDKHRHRRHTNEMMKCVGASECSNLNRCNKNHLGQSK